MPRWSAVRNGAKVRVVVTGHKQGAYLMIDPARPILIPSETDVEVLSPPEPSWWAGRKVHDVVLVDTPRGRRVRVRNSMGVWIAPGAASSLHQMSDAQILLANPVLLVRDEVPVTADV